VDNTEYINTVEWFFGYGGNHRGIKRVFPNMRLVAICEIEAYPLAVALEKMEKGLLDPCPVWTDCKTFPTKPFGCGRLDLFIASYPCTPFSAAGKRDGEKDPRHLWPFVRNFVETCRPKWVLFENVEGHITKGIVQVLADLEELAYTPVAGVFSAAEVGAPHQRKRVFILAHSESYDWRDDPFAKAVTAYPGRGKVGTGFGGLQVRVDSSLARDELADTRLFGPTFCEQQTTRAEQHCEERNELADPRGPELNRISKPEERYCDREARDSGVTQWPARPGEPQHPWEEPRTINGKLNANWVESLMNLPVGWTQLDGGGLEDNRIDRLRLLGNGVVPATAEKAFRTLYNEIMLKHEADLHDEIFEGGLVK